MAHLATNCARCLGLIALLSASRMFALGYSRLNSLATCSSMWLGTTMAGLWAMPRRRISMMAMIISAVLPAPTGWASKVAGSWSMRATAATW